MPDILPVRLQDILHSWKSELRKQQIIYHCENANVQAAVYSRCLLCVHISRDAVPSWYILRED